MEERTELANRPHKVSLNGRRTAVLTGVEDVLSFDDKEVLLETTEGTLLIRGEELHVNRLTVEKGEIDIEGRINSMAYSEQNSFKKNGESLFGRLFR